MDKIYVAIDKVTGKLLLGARGQSSFTRKDQLKRSLAQSYIHQRTAHERGVGKIEELYTIHEVPIERLKVNSGDFKVVETYRLIDDWDMRESLSINVYADGQVQGHIQFTDGEIEDNYLCRNFKDVHRITSLMEMAYRAGQAGMKFVYEYDDKSREEL